MTLGDYIQILSALATMFVGMVAIYGIFYPRIIAHRNRPKLTIAIEPIDESKKGLDFKVYNFGKTPAHDTVATLRMVDAEDGSSIGQWTIPWIAYSIEFSGTVERIMDGNYGPITIYPEQRINLHAFEILNIGPHQILGLNTLPFRNGSGFWPPAFWKLERLPENVVPTLLQNHKYAVYIDIYCEELPEATTKMTIISWNGKRLSPEIGELKMELMKQSALERRASRAGNNALISHEQQVVDVFRQLKKENK